MKFENFIEFWKNTVVPRIVVSKLAYVYWKRCSKVELGVSKIRQVDYFEPQFLPTMRMF